MSGGWWSERPRRAVGVAVAILLATGGLVAYGVDGALGLTYADAGIPVEQAGPARRRGQSCRRPRSRRSRSPTT